MVFRLTHIQNYNNILGPIVAPNYNVLKTVDIRSVNNKEVQAVMLIWTKVKTKDASSAIYYLTYYKCYIIILYTIVGKINKGDSRQI